MFMGVEIQLESEGISISLKFANAHKNVSNIWPSAWCYAFDLSLACIYYPFRCVLAELFLEGQPLFELSQLLAYRRGQYDPSQCLEKVLCFLWKNYKNVLIYFYFIFWMGVMCVYKFFRCCVFYKTSVCLLFHIFCWLIAFALKESYW